jgi:hypothetical protein
MSASWSSPKPVVTKSKAHERFARWCVENGRPDMRMSTSPAKFTARLKGLVRDVGEHRQHGQPRQYVGLRFEGPKKEN